MSKVFNQFMEDIAVTSGCDWDFVVEMYNHIWETHPDVDVEQFANGVIKGDWSIRGNWRFEFVLMDLCKKSGYTYDYLLDILTDMIYDPDDDCDIDFFIGVTMEHDW